MADLILVRGLPGAGKTTFAKPFVSQGYFHVEADMFFMEGDSYRFDPKKLGQAHSWCKSNVRRNLIGGINVIVSNTFTTIWEIQEYQKIARECSSNLIVYKATGNFKNVHNVPEEVLQKMAARWQDYPGEIVLPTPT